ncbi:endonuclease domain-containing protein [Nonomuraea sp. CA-218870]|uniref:endonuclease domain-containing protein n=1 Tax=Nonomuraea sp. CA-218870 TaxID=3239998 RepID=UPI003D911B8A
MSSPTKVDHQLAETLRADGAQSTAAEVSARKAAAGYRCQVCRKTDTKLWPVDRDPLAIDHDHRTKRVRGVLCQACNLSMRFFDDCVPEDRERYYANAMTLFTTARGVRGEPWYRAREGN